MLDQLPEVNSKRLAVRVTPDALRRVRSGHPWVYDRSVTSVSHDGEVGDLAVIFDRDRRFAAIGLWDPDSPIRIRILHAGSPAPIDAAFWEERCVEAVERRSPLWELEDRVTAGWRVVNGENDRLPGLVADCYAGTVVVKLDTGAWFPHLASVVPALLSATGGTSAVLRLARTVSAGPTFGCEDGVTLLGPDVTEPVIFTERGLMFEAAVRTGQKTGHFLDQRHNRTRVGARAAGRDVLDVFAATGGFTVHAAAGGARSVHSIDRSAPTLAAVARNLELNAGLETVRACRHTSAAADAFDALRGLRRDRRRFDIVVVDPPSFARRASEVDRALNAYASLTDLAVEAVRDRGLLVQSSCSSRVGAEEFFATVDDALVSRSIEAELLERTGHDIDHPATFAEGAYLKTGFWRIDRRFSRPR